MKVNEKIIKEWIEHYQTHKDVESIKKIIQEISAMVYHYPVVVFHRSYDDCAEFYLYFVEHFEKLFAKYNAQLAGFNTWFHIILKSQFLNWQRVKGRDQARAIPAFSYDDEHIKEDALFYQQEKHEIQNEKIEQIITHYIKQTDSTNYFIIHLLYFQMSDDIIKKLSEFNKKPFQVNLEKIKFYLNNNKKLKIQYEITNKIQLYQYKIFELKKQLSSDKKDIVKRYNSYKQSLESLKRKWNKNLENFDIKTIAELLSITPNEVYYRLNRIKKDLAEKLKEYVKRGS